MRRILKSEWEESAVFCQPGLPAKAADESHGAAARNQAIAAEEKTEIHLHELPCHPLVRGVLADDDRVYMVPSAYSSDVVPPPRTP